MLFENNVITVGQLGELIKSSIESFDFFSSVYVSGEIANYKLNYSSGHAYFTLKDERSQVGAVIFKSSLQNISFLPEDGISVIAHGRISYYAPYGKITFIVESIEPKGIGALYFSFLKLKEKLENEGLFDDSIKKPLPPVPMNVGLIAGAGSAALEDILNISKRRFPVADITFYPAKVQGEGSAATVIAGLEYLDSLPETDVIIVARGGGSFEDLNAFNDEKLARKVFACKKPVVSAIGHETDFTLIDFVSDVRAPTPSAAAELVFPNISSLKSQIESYRETIILSLKDTLQNKRSEIDNNLSSINRSVKNEIERYHDFFGGYIKRFSYILKSGVENERSLKLLPLEKSLIDKMNGYLEDKRTDIGAVKDNISGAVKTILSDFRDDISICADKLNALSPLAVIGRGYAGIFDINDRSVYSVNDINVGDTIKNVLSDGTIISEVKKTYGKEKD